MNPPAPTAGALGAPLAETAAAPPSPGGRRGARRGRDAGERQGPGQLPAGRRRRQWCGVDPLQQVGDLPLVVRVG
ncbi:hypothetical protein NGM37_52740 [Streptomyces sp. TRM76130]|nr:hypothetical protein [Streptomyces sp. TRM76130]